MTIDNQNVGLRRVGRPRPTWHQQAPPTGKTISAPTVTRRTARVELTRSQLVQERSLLAHGNFLARSARTGPTSGTRASGRQRPKRSSGQQLRLWAESAPTRVASRRTGIRAEADIPSRARNSLHRPQRSYAANRANRSLRRKRKLSCCFPFGGPSEFDRKRATLFL